MTTYWRRSRSSLLALADQAWLSVISLATSLLFVRYGAKADYGVYVLLLTPLTLLVGVMNALVASPAMSLYPAAGERQPVVLATAWVALMALMLGASLLAVLGLSVAPALGQPVGQVGLFALFTYGFAAAAMLAREGGRSLAYAQENAGGAFQQDLIYGVLMLAGLAFLLWRDDISSWNVFGVIAVSGWVLLIPAARNRRLALANLPAWHEMWACGKWALPGVVTTWINLNSYLLFAAAMLGAEPVADIGASRLFMVPIALGIGAWSNVFRPKLALLAAQGDANTMRQIAVRSTVFVAALVGILTLALTLIFPWLERLLGPSYTGLAALVLMWGLYFVLTGARTVAMGVLMTEASGYRQLAILGTCLVLVSTGALIFATPFGSIWVVAALCVVELVQLLAVGGLAARRLKSMKARS
jgi:O-antigen/teichoic acid export membrane protein